MYNVTHEHTPTPLKPPSPSYSILCAFSHSFIHTPTYFSHSTAFTFTTMERTQIHAPPSLPPHPYNHTHITHTHTCNHRLLANHFFFFFVRRPGAGVSYDYDIHSNLSRIQRRTLARIFSTTTRAVPEYLDQCGADKGRDQGHRDLKAHRKATLHRTPAQNGSESTAWVVGALFCMCACACVCAIVCVVLLHMKCCIFSQNPVCNFRMSALRLLCLPFAFFASHFGCFFAYSHEKTVNFLFLGRDGASFVCSSLEPEHRREIHTSQSHFLSTYASTMDPQLFGMMRTFEVSRLTLNSWSLIPRRNLRKQRTSLAPSVVCINLPGRCDTDGNMKLFPAVVESVLHLRFDKGGGSAEDRYIVAIRYFSCSQHVEKTFKSAWADRFAGCPSNFLTIARVFMQRPDKFIPLVQPSVHFLPLCSVVCPAVMHTVTLVPRALRRANFAAKKHQLVFPHHKWWVPGSSTFSCSVEIFR